MLSEIFRFARPPIDFTAHGPTFYDYHRPSALIGDYNPDEDCLYTLGFVSHRWRQVALLTPHLWTSISLRVYIILPKYKTSLLDLHFKNANDLPISIRLDFRDASRMWRSCSWRNFGLEPLSECIFVENADKIRNLILIWPPPDWSTSTCGNLPQCDSVTIGWPHPYRDADEYFGDGTDHIYSFDLGNLSHLRRISLVGFHFPFSLQSLLGSPHLAALNFVDVITRIKTSNAPHNMAIEPVVLHHLEKLTCRKTCVDNNHDLFRHLRFIKLTTLEWCERASFYEPPSEEGKRLQLAFFSALPSTLSSLTLNCMNNNSPSIIDLLNCVPQLTELYFNECPEKVVRSVVERIGRRWANTDPEPSPSSNFLVPNLCVLSLSSTVSDPESELSPYIFLDMFETLGIVADSRTKPFHLMTNSDVDWDWDIDGRSDALDQFRVHLLGLDAILTFKHADGSTLTVS